MFHVEMYYQVRRACLAEGMSVREASRVFGVHRDTVRKMLANAMPQGYTRKRPRIASNQMLPTFRVSCHEMRDG